MDLNKIITGEDLCTIDFALHNRIEFLSKKKDEYSYSPGLLEFYDFELAKTYVLAEKLNIYIITKPIL